MKKIHKRPLKPRAKKRSSNKSPMRAPKRTISLFSDDKKSIGKKQAGTKVKLLLKTAKSVSQASSQGSKRPKSKPPKGPKSQKKSLPPKGITTQSMNL